MDDLRHQDEIDRGVHAEKILRDSLYLESYEIVRRALLDKIETSPHRDVEGREQLFKMLRALKDVRGALEQAMREGKLALHLREEQTRLSKLNPFRRKA